MISLPQDILILAPHTDDAELGCGGAMARFVEAGVKVHVAAFSTATEALPAGARPTMLRDEFVEAMNVLGLPENQVHIFDFPLRRLSSYRQELLEELIKLRTAIKPSTVYLPSGADLHQDHQAVFAEGLRAFKDVTVWGYELPWNHIEFKTNAFVTINRRHLEMKWELLQCYRSQLALKRPYFSMEFIEGLARVRGVQVKAEFAEAFEVIRQRI